VPVPQEVAPTDQGTPAGAGGAPSAMGPGGGAGMAPGMNPGGMGGSQSDAATPNHKVNKYRYYETEAEVRRVPVALVLIVDANHIADVLTAFANTRLRVQVTQAVWTRLPQGIGRPSTPASSDQTGPPAGGSSRETAGTPSVSGGIGNKGGANVGMTALKPDEETLQVELQIYGLATIYEDPEAAERIRKDRESSAAPATPAAPTTPPTPGK
jgi:hypothetical protein